MPLTRVEFFDISFDKKNNAPVLFLKDVSRDLFLPVWIGELEAASIQLAVLKQSVGRPLTHDLILDILTKADIKVIQLNIDRLVNSTYYATLVLEQNGIQIEVDSRPSDGIALAVRKSVPIFVNSELMYRIHFTPPPEGEESGGDDGGSVRGELGEADFKDLLRDMRPQDFQEDKP